MVLSPNIHVFHEMERLISILPSYDNGDQGFLNEYYKNSWHALPYAYNAQQPDYISNPLQWNIGKFILIKFNKIKMLTFEFYRGY